MVSNTGTYLDTPFHRFADGHDLAGLDLQRVVDVPGLLIDATGGQEATLPDDVDVAGRAVLFHTGWDRHWDTDDYGDPSHPFVGMAAIERLVAGGAAVVGIDSVNIDDTRTGERPVHTALLGAGIPIVEHLRGLDALVGGDVHVHRRATGGRRDGDVPGARAGADRSEAEPADADRDEVDGTDRHEARPPCGRRRGGGRLRGRRSTPHRAWRWRRS